MDRNEPLYRKVNTRTHRVRHGHGGEARWLRNTKASRQAPSLLASMHPHRRHGRDYTPLFKFLLSRVGCDWDETYSEAVRRLDRADPIFWLVARSEAEKRPLVALGESTYFSGLYITEDNVLALVDPTLRVEALEPDCACCTHTFNGIRFTRAFRPRRPHRRTPLAR